MAKYPAKKINKKHRESEREESIGFWGQLHLTPTQWLTLRVHTLMKSALACEEQQCPFLPTASMNKSHHATLWNSHVRLEAKSLTITGDDPERDCVPGFLDQVHDVRVRLVGDGAAVHRQYSVPDFQLPAAVRRAALDDASYFVGHGHTSISSCCFNPYVRFTCVRNKVWWWFDKLICVMFDLIWFKGKGRKENMERREKGRRKVNCQITKSQFTHRKPISCVHIVC